MPSLEGGFGRVIVVVAAKKSVFRDFRHLLASAQKDTLGEICWEKAAFVQEQAEKLIFVG